MSTSIDCTFKTDLGNFNFRIGVIISNGRKILMARNPRDTREYYYSVGGRVRFAETLEDAVRREVKEETGIDCKVNRMAAVHENFFMDDDGVPYHEISVFFTLKPNEKLLEIKDGHLTDQGPGGEYLEWIDLDSCEDKTIYPDFFKTMDFTDDSEVKHFVNIEDNFCCGTKIRLNQTEVETALNQPNQPRKKDAENTAQKVIDKSVNNTAEETAIAYTDGSYNPQNGMWGYGACLYVDDTEYELSGNGEDVYNGRQIQGEITAALAVCEKALSLGIRRLEIRYDYEGVKQWATGTWKTNKPYTKDYSVKMQEYCRQMKITFTHVKAHTGIEGNEKVDQLAKAACGAV